MRSRTRFHQGIAVAAVALLVCASCTSHRSSSATPVGQVVPSKDRPKAGDLHGSLLAGGDYRLSADQGHVTLVNFFASWCGPCAAETPQLDAFFRQHGSTGTRLVGMDVKDGTQANSRSWLADEQVSYPVVWDQPGKTAIELGRVSIGVLPATVLVDKHGRIAAVYQSPLTAADLQAPVAQLAAES